MSNDLTTNETNYISIEQMMGFAKKQWRADSKRKVLTQFCNSVEAIKAAINSELQEYALGQYDYSVCDDLDQSWHAWFTFENVQSVDIQPRFCFRFSYINNIASGLVVVQLAEWNDNWGVLVSLSKIFSKLLKGELLQITGEAPGILIAMFPLEGIEPIEVASTTLRTATHVKKLLED